MSQKDKDTYSVLITNTIIDEGSNREKERERERDTRLHLNLL